MCFCFTVVGSQFRLVSWDAFAYILQGCFTGTGAIEYCPSASEVTLKDTGKIHHYLTTTDHNKSCTVLKILKMYCTLVTIILYIYNNNKSLMYQAISTCLIMRNPGDKIPWGTFSIFLSDSSHMSQSSTPLMIPLLWARTIISTNKVVIIKKMWISFPGDVTMTHHINTCALISI